MSKRTDISQEIKKYLNGELDARAMHSLERRAQDDPFLMDALEGYEKAGTEQDIHLNELAQRLHQRTEKTERRIIPYRTMGIAASILLFLGIGSFWYLNRTPQQHEVTKTAAITPPTVKGPAPLDASSQKNGAADKAIDTSTKQSIRVATSIATNIRKHSKPAPSSETAFVPPVVAEPKTTQYANAANADKVIDTTKTTTSLDEMVVMDYSAQKKVGKTLKIGIPAADSLIKLPGTTITGVVKDNNGPLPGASVRINGTDIATLTDRQGGFTLTNAPDRTVLDFGYMGYRSKQVPVYKADSMIIAMQPNTSSLNEVMVTGFGTKKRTMVFGGGPAPKEVYLGKPVKGMIKDVGEPVPGATVRIKGTNKTTLTDAKGRFTLYGIADNTMLDVTAEGYLQNEVKVVKPDMQIIPIHPDGNSTADNAAQANDNNQMLPPRPSGGWDDFDDYLKQNAASPDGKAGTVKLTFTVNADNSLSDFKIIKGVSAQTDNAAIKLIWIGPTWFSRSDDQPETVTVSIKFKADKK